MKDKYPNLYNKNKCIGILGGMGFYASIIFQKQFKIIWMKIILLKQNMIILIIFVIRIQNYLVGLVHIFLNDKSLLPQLKNDIIKLNKMGVSFIIMPCNTVHYYDELQKISNCKILNMIEIVSDYLINIIILILIY